MLQRINDTVQLGPIATGFSSGEGPSVSCSSLPTMTSPITLARACRNTLLPTCLPFPIFSFPFPFFHPSSLSYRSPILPIDVSLVHRVRDSHVRIQRNGSVSESYRLLFPPSFPLVPCAFVGNLNIESRRVARESRLQDFCKSRSIFYERRRSSFSVHRLPSNRVYHRVHTLSS